MAFIGTSISQSLRPMMNYEWVFVPGPSIVHALDGAFFTNHRLPQVASCTTMAENQASKGRVRLNVGGQVFETSFSTLTRFDTSMFSALVAGQWQKEDLFIDRNPNYFAKVLDYLRDGESVVLPEDDISLKSLRREAEFYNLPGLVEMCSSKLLEKYNYPFCGERVKIIVSGAVFGISLDRATSVKDSLLSAMIAGRGQHEELFIDRDPTHFEKVLNYLRDGEKFIPPLDDDTRESLLIEAEFYKLPRLAELCGSHAGDKVQWTKSAIKTYDLISLSYFANKSHNCTICNSVVSKERLLAKEVLERTGRHITGSIDSLASAKGLVVEVDGPCCIVRYQYYMTAYDIHVPKSALRLANSD